jgi:hypothetical protein
MECREPANAPALDRLEIGQAQCDAAGADPAVEQLVERLDVVDAEWPARAKSLPNQGDFQLVGRVVSQGSRHGIAAHGTFSIIRGTAGWEI